MYYIIKEEILTYLRYEAKSEEIEYTDTNSSMSFIRFYFDTEDHPDGELGNNDYTAVAVVLKRINPYNHRIHVFTEFIGPYGEMDEMSLSNLKDVNGLERITKEKFEEIKKSFYIPLPSS
jgi:hypothetical protein